MPGLVDKSGAAADIGPQTEQMLKDGEQVQLIISGDSMRPTVKPRRDAVVLEPMRTWPPKYGDILFFRSERSPSGYTLHRVVRVKADGPYMNGDAQNWTEGPIDRGNVLGIAVALVRNGKIVDVNGRLYRLYVRCWAITRKGRWQMFAVWRGIKRLVGRK